MGARDAAVVEDGSRNGERAPTTAVVVTGGTAVSASCTAAAGDVGESPAWKADAHGSGLSSRDAMGAVALGNRGSAHTRQKRAPTSATE